MKLRKIIITTACCLAVALPAAAQFPSGGARYPYLNPFFWWPSHAPVESPETEEEWYQEGRRAIRLNSYVAARSARNARSTAKNVILFVGDGMGISTVTAARILEGQQLGLDGEEHELFFETFPHVALSKTFNTNQQTPDSAGTMSAIMTGVKTDAGLISVNQDANVGNCQSQLGNEVITALELAEINGMATGVVSTARITHATPAATYSHSFSRNFEDDHDKSQFGGDEGVAGCEDIASQLLSLPDRFADRFPWVDGVEVVMGGGRRGFLPRVEGVDPEAGGRGERDDLRDLTQEWVDGYSNAQYIWNQEQFDNLDVDNVDHLLALFNMSHMEYEVDRADDVGGEPSLSEMTGKAIDILSNNRNGYFLQVEAARIDHAHHGVNPYRSLTDTIALSDAVRTAYENTDPRETLIIVTADHSHVFTLAGYPTRGNPILGKVIGNGSDGSPATSFALGLDGLPYTTVGYSNGGGSSSTVTPILDDDGNPVLGDDGNPTYDVATRSDLTDVDTEDPDFRQESLVFSFGETHGAEDVAIYATGPGSALFSGVLEQNAIFHVMSKAAHLERDARYYGWRRD